MEAIEVITLFSTTFYLQIVNRLELQLLHTFIQNKLHNTNDFQTCRYPKWKSLGSLVTSPQIGSTINGYAKDHKQYREWALINKHQLTPDVSHYVLEPTRAVNMNTK